MQQAYFLREQQTYTRSSQSVRQPHHPVWPRRYKDSWNEDLHRSKMFTLTKRRGGSLNVWILVDSRWFTPSCV
ncbi:unnamed protein product [Pleuronectes platessa]|uniref:Uncharacterized protein n=1 Tax=Pleuronectes platessa TaxID=8262 RepID=A0A9N7VKL7_PLEPL|nr:unnamed protein product [Pleuronectes platessa]